MAYERNTARRFYKKLIGLYPKSFKEQLGESMEQTFNDLYREHVSKGASVSGLIIWTFTETSLGIIKEHMSIKNIYSNFTIVAIIGLLITIPFFILEAITTSGFARSGFPLALFIIMWIHAGVLSIIAVSVVRTVRKGEARTRPVLFLIKIALLVYVSWGWLGWVIDQMPCFLGGSGC